VVTHRLHSQLATCPNHDVRVRPTTLVGGGDCKGVPACLGAIARLQVSPGEDPASLSTTASAASTWTTVPHAPDVCMNSMVPWIRQPCLDVGFARVFAAVVAVAAHTAAVVVH